MLRRNNKGFTMSEILAAVIIIGVLMMIAVPAVSKLMKGFRNDYYKEVEETITASAKEFFLDNKIYRPDGLLKSSYTSIKSLIDKGYVDELVDYKGKACSLKAKESYVVVINRGTDKYEYKTCIKCSGDNYMSDSDGTYCDSAWLTNDNIKYEFSESDEFYIYYATPKEEVRNKLLKNVNIVKYNKKGVALDRIVLAEGSKDNILPKDIDTLDTTPALDASNKKETVLHYNIENNDKEIKIVVYKHKKPMVEMEDADGKVYDGSYWTNKLIIKLAKNDEFYDLSNTSIASFQWSFNDGSWENINCELESKDTCSVTINKNVEGSYRFRIVTNEGKLSDETGSYLVKVDVDNPMVDINPNGDEPIVYVSSTTGTISFSLDTSDTGGSNIKNRKYGINTSATEIPSTFTKFSTDKLDVSKVLEGNNYYVWAQVVDYAGNVSTGVWPSKAFNMKYEVIYDANGGSGAPKTSYKKHGTDLTLSSTVPTRTGYNFKGWTTSSNGSVVYSASDKYTNEEAIKLYAVWEAETYKVTYDGNGGLWNGKSSWSNTVTYNTGYTTSNNLFERTGYNFIGWKDQNGNDWTEWIDKERQWNYNYDVTLYAQWTPKTYTVTYDANGGTVSTTSDTTTYGSSVILPTPERSEYKFNGWYTSSTGGVNKGLGGSAYKVEADITLYAQWTSMIPEHTCSGKARSWNNSTYSRDAILKYWKVNQYNHWCSSSKTTESCIPSQYDSNGKYMTMYDVTCEICGKNFGDHWCPVHGSGGNATSGGGGKSYPICDANSKRYSIDATNCVGASLGWTLVSK